ncbi:hypothetical protein RRG08_010666 [Elysia crispata]|uniref:poly(ADP-ribose) glycohydrolase n=1 Tax=Elysia crispata TaxID=231223 RepID=A0AAE1D8U9_9GAST|nr:hypothetical protein RRG08_010666 [Elysia crispata]
MSKRLAQTRLHLSGSGLKFRTSPKKRPFPFKKSYSEGSAKEGRRSNMSYAQAAGGQGPSRNFSEKRNFRGRGFKPRGQHSQSFRSPAHRSPVTESPDSTESPNVINQLTNRDHEARTSSYSYYNGKSKTVEAEDYKSIDWDKLRRAPDCYVHFLPPLKYDRMHKVLFKVPPQGWSNSLVDPYPNMYRDTWEEAYVYMPCSNYNVIPSQHDQQVSRWKMIEDVLSEQITSVFELEEAVLSYNQHYTHRWDFNCLRQFFCQDLKRKDEFFTHTLPFIQKLALSLPSLVTQPLPFLKQGHESKLTISQQQAACLLANAFFCTFPKRNARMKYAILPDINFSNLYRGGPDDSMRKIEKLKCIVNYFNRIHKKMPTGIITFTRHVLHQDLVPKWDESTVKLTDLYVSSEGNIEDDGAGMLQADFANKYVGGGVLGRGLVQEEIRFAICPEMILSRLFTPVLQDHEVLIMTGCERFNDYKGYSDTFQFTGDYVDETPRDTWGRKNTEVVAMDALFFRDPETQYEKSKILREVNKAYCAFQGTEFSSYLPAVCTGNWGCGAFRGDKHLKALIQLMAASVAGRQVCYFTFDDKTLESQLRRVHGMLRKLNITVKELFKLILDYSSKVLRKRHHYWETNETLFEFIASALGESLGDTPRQAHGYNEDDFETQEFYDAEEEFTPDSP